MWIWANGGKIIPDGEFLGTKLLLDDKAAGAMKFLRNLVTLKVNAPLGSWLRMFLDGKAAIVECHSGDIPELLGPVGFDWDILPLPKGPTGLKAATVSTDGYLIPKNSKHPKEAAEFIKYLASPETQEFLMKEVDLIPARGSLARLYLRDSKAARAGKKVRYYIDAIPYARPIPEFLDGSIWGIIYTNWLAAVFEGSIAPEEAVLRTVQQANAILAKAREQTKK